LLFAPPVNTLGDPVSEDLYETRAVDLLNAEGLRNQDGSTGITRDMVVNSVAGPPPVTLTGTDVAASVRVLNRPMLVWHAAPKPRNKRYLPLPKPYVFPLYTPGGVNVLDYAPDDHPHHKGLWVSVDEVELHLPGKNGGEGETLGPFKHWVEQGRIETQSVQRDAEAGSIRSVNHWLSPNGTPVMAETTLVTAHGNGLIEYDITLSPPPGGGTVKIGDTKEGFLGVRMAKELTAKGGAGVITNSEGGRGESECWGKPAAWCDYSAPAGRDGSGGGVALFDHPKNERPARYHVRAYGLMAVSPFGPKAYTKGKESAAPIEITADNPLRLRYAAYVHLGDAEGGGVSDAYRTYATAIRD
jgi:hypothetical protein